MPGINQSLYIGLDFDGTVVTHAYPDIGKDIGAIPVLHALMEAGHKLILNTMRSGPELAAAVDYCKAQQIELYGINHNPDQSAWTSSPKVYAHVYIDDVGLGIPLSYNTALSSRAFVDWPAVKRLLIAQRVL